MDKIAIISDVHGCYISLKEVLDDIEKKNIKHIFMLGDLIAKGSQPKEVIELIRKRCEVVIKGNCDDIIGGNKCVTDEHFWNREKIGEENVHYLNNLPEYYDFYMSGLKIRLVHANPNDLYNSISYYNITDNINAEMENMFSINDTHEIPDVIIFGHIHSPFIYKMRDKMLINSGSVSNSCDLIEKNNDIKLFSSYLILEGNYNSLDIDTISYEIVRIPFNYEKEIDNLKNSDMPNKDMAIKELTTGIYIKR